MGQGDSGIHDQMSTQQLIWGNLGANLEREGGRWFPEDMPRSQSPVDESRQRTGGDNRTEMPGVFTDHNCPWTGVTILLGTKKRHMPFGSPGTFLVLMTMESLGNLYGDGWLCVAVVVDLGVRVMLYRLKVTAWKGTPGF